MATPVGGFLLPVVLTNDAGVVLPLDAINGIGVNLATKLAGEDLTNDWLKTRLASVGLAKWNLVALFASSTVAGGANNYGEWINLSNYSRWCIWVKVSQTYTIFVNGRPIGQTGLQKAVHASSAGVAAGTVTILSNMRPTQDNNFLCDELQIQVQNTSGSSGTIDACLFAIP